MAAWAHYFESGFANHHLVLGIEKFLCTFILQFFLIAIYLFLFFLFVLYWCTHQSQRFLNETLKYLFTFPHFQSYLRPLVSFYPFQSSFPFTCPCLTSFTRFNFPYNYPSFCWILVDPSPLIVHTRFPTTQIVVLSLFSCHHCESNLRFCVLLA